VPGRLAVGDPATGRRGPSRDVAYRLPVRIVGCGERHQLGVALLGGWAAARAVPVGGRSGDCAGESSNRTADVRGFEPVPPTKKPCKSTLFVASAGGRRACCGPVFGRKAPRCLTPRDRNSISGESRGTGTPLGDGISVPGPSPDLNPAFRLRQARCLLSTKRNGLAGSSRWRAPVELVSSSDSRSRVQHRIEALTKDLSRCARVRWPSEPLSEPSRQHYPAPDPATLLAYSPPPPVHAADDQPNRVQMTGSRQDERCTHPAL
jgi:hypothetical protein